MVAQLFIDQQYPVTRVLNILGISKSVYYFKPKPIKDYLQKGIKKTEFTMKENGSYVSNQTVVKDIKKLLSHEFVDYGYLKVTYYLQDELQYLINHKKVYRLMKESSLLNIARPKQKNKKNWVTELVPTPTEAFTYWEFDIKFIYIHGTGRYAPMLSIIDVYSRYLIGWFMEWSIKKEDVVAFFDSLKTDYVLPENIFVRCDNGSQFESNLLREYLLSQGITQEFTKPATPEQNAHIESYHSIIQRAVCSRFEFTTLNNCKKVFERWEKFYNEDRIHSGINYKSPLKYLNFKNIIVPKKRFIKKKV
jgi:putative transposase